VEGNRGVKSGGFLSLTACGVWYCVFFCIVLFVVSQQAAAEIAWCDFQAQSNAQQRAN
jgi:hypothetical protein